MAPKRKRRHRSKVRQFYSDFNSESSDSPSDSESDIATSEPAQARWGGGQRRSRRGQRRNRNTQAQVFTFDRRANDHSMPRAPRQNGAAEDYDNANLSPRSKSVGPRPMSPWGTHSKRRGPELENPLSPGVTNNQDLKDRAYELIYQNKIKDLRSTVHNDKIIRYSLYLF